jgi:LacI family transcriptional regulator, galactose operon repressor
LRNRLTATERGVAAPKRSVTLADVAEVAGVSASTASRALNGRGELSDATRAAVLEAAEALKFRPSALARSLRTRQSHTVGFVVPDVASPFYASALKGAQRVLEDAGYRVMLMDSEQDVAGEVAALRTLLEHQVDGLLVSTTGVPARVFREVAGTSGRPCVFFDGILAGAGAGSVSLDNHTGIALLIEHLVEHGHERIAVLAGSQRETSGIERLQAFRAAMRAHGLRVRRGYERPSPWSLEHGRVDTHAVLALATRPTAIVTASVELALGCMAACRELGLRIPDDLALVAFDDSYFAALLDPPLTSIAYDPEEVGRDAAGLLVDAMRGASNGRHELVVPVHLVRRRSCGCPA